MCEVLRSVVGVSGGTSSVRTCSPPTYLAALRSFEAVVPSGERRVILCLNPWTYATTYVDAKRLGTTINPDEAARDDTDGYASSAEGRLR